MPSQRAGRRATSHGAATPPGGRAPGAHSTGAHAIPRRGGRRFTLWSAALGVLAIAAAGIGLVALPHGGDDGETSVIAGDLSNGLAEALRQATPLPSASASATASATPSAAPTTPASATPAPPTAAPTGSTQQRPGGGGGGGAAPPPGGGGGRIPGGLSGVVVGTMTHVNAWEQFRGSKVNVVHGYAARDNWQNMTNPWMGSAFAGFSGQLVISQPFWPTGGGDFNSCANGSYSEQWKQFGRYLVNIGRPSTIVRLAWEFNGDWFPWSVSNTNPDTWKRCFQQVVSAIRSTDPQVRIDWTMNRHSGQPYEVYPGDSYVDIVGVDVYDMWPQSVDEAGWASQCNSSAGLCDVIRFAKQHGKQFSVSEWGVVGKSDTGAGRAGQAGGDNPFFIKKMYDTFKANAGDLAYETYFNSAEANNVHSSLLNPNENPNAASTYASLW
ncbi:beta-mannanase [Frankia sp. CNm7]|uniref:Beta-mannanase n=1 Tax=Frankia nepalensis TaxID=1836974 RepID=A0A937URC6_9ACTN|nr:beta-mannanase [Frankia nepalensis]MBL7516241.1 beta-mannanase [Frankia nepalensis]MBL7519589.1 beta-mannanase [Frankia nepalensis]MBL7632729.1 beta-mannanase [Frankia nepalensis]